MTVKVGNQKNALPNWLRAGFGVLIFLTVMATIKALFFGLDRNEAYVVTVAYRLVQGDRLFLEMWEPHQTSAILSAVFIKLFYLILLVNVVMVIWTGVCVYELSKR